jgi:hypothetical protein
MADGRSVPRGEAIDRALVPGVLAGIAAAVVMGLFATVAAATYRHLQLSAPLREIAVLASPELAANSPAQQLHLAREPLIFAGAIHLAVGALFGAVFGLAARAARLRGAAAVAAGALYGLVVMALMSLVVLPAAGGLSGAGEPISNLAGRVGWATFAAAHLLFGLALGLWVLVRPWDVARDPTAARDLTVPRDEREVVE